MNDLFAKKEIIGAYGLTKSLLQGEVESAVDILQKYADTNNSLAQFFLAECYRDGISVKFCKNPIVLEKNENKMIELYIKATIAGNSDARYHLAECCESGLVSTEDTKNASCLYSANEDNNNSCN